MRDEDTIVYEVVGEDDRDESRDTLESWSGYHRVGLERLSTRYHPPPGRSTKRSVKLV